MYNTTNQNSWWPYGLEEFFDVETCSYSNSWYEMPTEHYDIRLNDRIKSEYALEFIDVVNILGYPTPFNDDYLLEYGPEECVEECAKKLINEMNEYLDVKMYLDDGEWGKRIIANLKSHMAYATARIEAAIHSVDYTDEEMYQDECDLMMEQDMMDEEYDDPYEPYGLSEPYGFIMH